MDGIDELLKVFAVYAFGEWPEDFTEVLRESPGRALLIRADPAGDGPCTRWLVRTGSDHLTAEGGPGAALDESVRPDVTISGTATALLRWAWNRDGTGDTPGQATSVLIDGDLAAVAEFRGCMVEVTQ